MFITNWFEDESEKRKAFSMDHTFKRKLFFLWQRVRMVRYPNEGSITIYYSIGYGISEHYMWESDYLSQIFQFKYRMINGIFSKNEETICMTEDDVDTDRFPFLLPYLKERFKTHQRNEKLKALLTL